MITLSRQNGIWVADYSQSCDAAQIYKLFGTYHIPTAYTDKSPAPKVLAAIQILNEESVVLLDN